MREDPVREKITQARVTLLFKHPFFGNLAMRWNIIEASSWCPTAATDGRNLYYNREFILSLSPAELIFLLAHEILHMAFEHFIRRGSRDSGLWNMANDYVVNGILTDEKIGKMPSRVVVQADKSTGGISQRVGLYKEKYRGWSSEEVYEDLLANSVTIELPLDVHLEPSDNDDGEENGASVRVISDDGPPRITTEEAERIREEFRTAMIQAAQAVAGRVPAGIKRLIDDAVDPKLNWRQMIDIHLQSARYRDYSYTVRNRKSQSTNTILPGLKKEEGIEVAIAVDASGSVTMEMLKDFLSEIFGILQQFNDYVVDLWSFDGEVHNHQTFTPDNREEMLQYEILGSGGTVYEVNWDYMREHDILPQRFILFTDGYPNSGWGDPDYCETLFVIHSNPRTEAPFGVTAHYEEEASRP